MGNKISASDCHVVLCQGNTANIYNLSTQKLVRTFEIYMPCRHEHAIDWLVSGNLILATTVTRASRHKGVAYSHELHYAQISETVMREAYLKFPNTIIAHQTVQEFSDRAPGWMACFDVCGKYITIKHSTAESASTILFDKDANTLPKHTAKINTPLDHDLLVVDVPTTEYVGEALHVCGNATMALIKCSGCKYISISIVHKNEMITMSPGKVRWTIPCPGRGWNVPWTIMPFHHNGKSTPHLFCCDIESDFYLIDLLRLSDGEKTGFVWRCEIGRPGAVQDILNLPLDNTVAFCKFTAPGVVSLVTFRKKEDGKRTPPTGVEADVFCMYGETQRCLLIKQKILQLSQKYICLVSQIGTPAGALAGPTTFLINIFDIKEKKQRCVLRSTLHNDDVANQNVRLADDRIIVFAQDGINVFDIHGLFAPYHIGKLTHLARRVNAYMGILPPIIRVKDLLQGGAYEDAARVLRMPAPLIRIIASYLLCSYDCS